MSEDLRTYSLKAERYLSTARLLAASEYPNGAFTNSYYACFWLVRGLLLEKGVVAKKHSGAHQIFGLHFIKSSEIPAVYSDYLFDFFEQRQLADYDIDGEFDTEQVHELIHKADEFIAFINWKYA